MHLAPKLAQYMTFLLRWPTHSRRRISRPKDDLPWTQADSVRRRLSQAAGESVPVKSRATSRAWRRRAEENDHTQRANEWHVQQTNGGLDWRLERACQRKEMCSVARLGSPLRGP